MTDEPFSDMRAWRETMGLNTYEAAEALGVSRTLIWELEKSGAAPKRTVQLAMQALAEGRGTPLDRRVTELEAEVAALKRLLQPRSTPLPVLTPTVSRGCVCPPGAEFGCASTGCPRRPFGPITTTALSTSSPA